MGVDDSNVRPQSTERLQKPAECARQCTARSSPCKCGEVKQKSSRRDFDSPLGISKKKCGYSSGAALKESGKSDSEGHPRQSSIRNPAMQKFAVHHLSTSAG